MTMPNDMKLNAEGVDWARMPQIASIRAWLCRKYAIHGDARRRKMGLEYIKVEVADLAEEIDRYICFLADSNDYRLVAASTLAALDNSKPTPAVVDDGLIERLRRNADLLMQWESWELGDLPVPDALHHADTATLVREAASALAAAHSQHEADVARIGELEAALRPFGLAAAYIDSVSASFADDYRPRDCVKLGDLRHARSALAKVKP